MPAHLVVLRVETAPEEEGERDVREGVAVLAQQVVGVAREVLPQRQGDLQRGTTP